MLQKYLKLTTTTEILDINRKKDQARIKKKKKKKKQKMNTTDRVASICVPVSFMDWKSNRSYL